ncbi:MAG: hypothetical protein APR63_09375 [Desulfuromonas sp. SDB]|nr:MAG: hypothetical protein APR63_09375 [Desulfuromonas sp. SDB]
MRIDGRTTDQARKVEIIAPFQNTAPGSCLIKNGNTWVCCSVSYQENVPAWMKNEGRGWLTAEYGMLPGSSSQRVKRERNFYNARSLEIGRLIGRSLRASMDLSSLPQMMFYVDCDVLQADGGTRTASISGAWVALVMSVHHLLNKKIIKTNPIIQQIAALSGGLVKEALLVDLNYQEDSQADFDANFILTKEHDIVEIQATAEGYPIERKKFNKLLDKIIKSSDQIFEVQDQVLENLGINAG